MGHLSICHYHTAASGVHPHLIELDYNQAKPGIKMQPRFTPQKPTAPLLAKTHIAMHATSSPLGSKHFFSLCAHATSSSAVESLPSE